MIWPALLLGLAGSLHCAGMCGPLMLALPTPATSRTQWLIGRFAYQGGRILTYAVMGALFGLLGQALVLAGFQRALSIALGAAMLAAALITPFAGYSLADRLGLTRAVRALKRVWAGWWGRRDIASLSILGALNGLLPCGLVYVALAGAAATGSAASGTVFLAVFGLGTLPMMLALSLAGSKIAPPLALRLRRLVPVAVGVVGLLLILRGLDLGIPYLSPKLHADSPAHSCCHH